MTNSHYRFPDFQLSVIETMLISVIFIFAVCSSSCRTNPDTGEDDLCPVYDFVATPGPGNVILDPGGSQGITISAVVSAPEMCGDMASTFSIAVISDNHPGISLSGCANASMDNNSGTCSATIAASPQAQPGHYVVEYLATAVMSDGGTAVDTKTIGVTITDPPDFSLTIPTGFGAGQGLSFTVAATVNRTGGHDEDIHLSLDNVPIYVTYLFEPNPVNVTNPSSQLTISPPQNSVPGDYSIELIGSDGTLERHAIFNFYIMEPFYPTIDPENITIAQGQSGNITVYANRLAVFFDLIFYGAEGDIVGPGKDLIEPVFDPNPTTESSVDLTLNVGEDVPAGTYTLTITASFDNLLKSVELPVTVVI